MGPTCESAPHRDGGQVGTRPAVGLWPTMPLHVAGIRIEPPPSVPTASGPSPAASAAAAPPLLPPGLRSRFHGFRVMPVSGLSVTNLWPSSGVVVFPRITAPCSRRRATAGASSSHG